MYVQQVFIVFIKFLMFFVKLKIFLCRMYLVRLSVTDVALGGGEGECWLCKIHNILPFMTPYRGRHDVCCRNGGCRRSRKI